MRHLDLLALWCQLNPDSHELNNRRIAATSKEALVALILGSAR
jgi:hypothetical protein